MASRNFLHPLDAALCASCIQWMPVRGIDAVFRSLLRAIVALWLRVPGAKDSDLALIHPPHSLPKTSTPAAGMSLSRPAVLAVPQVADLAKAIQAGLGATHEQDVLTPAPSGGAGASTPAGPAAMTPQASAALRRSRLPHVSPRLHSISCAVLGTPSRPALC
jgi:hypothetical protein